MIAAVLVALVALGWLAYVLAPLRAPHAPERDPDTPRRSLEEAKIAALIGILDLEEERDAGKLDAGDFHQLRRAYEADAVVALKALDETGTAPGSDLEAEIAAVRARLSHETCPGCGARRVPGEPCAACGD